MNCSRVEKYLALLAGGEADPHEEALAKAHLRSCARCARFFAELQAVHNDLDSVPAFSLIPQAEADGIVAACLDKAVLPVRHEPRLRRPSWLAAPGFALAAAAVLVAAAGFFLTPILRQNGAPKHGGIAAAGIQNGQRVIAVSQDSTLFLGQSCTVHLLKGGRCTILRADDAVVKIDLQYGRILLAAQKGRYDTIAVYSGAVRTFATGTHFEVDYFSDLTSVSVLEGKVKVTGFRGKETPVGALEECTFSAQNDAPLPRGFDLRTQQRMINDFAAMTAANTRYELATSAAGNAPTEVRRTKKPHPRRQSPNLALDSAAAHEYAIARAMIGKAKYATAAHVLEDYLAKYRYKEDSVWFDLAFCYSTLRRFDDAVELYHRITSESIDEPLIETALHRSNKILFLKFDEYDEARHGIEEYLSKYPHGLWREEEWYYRIKIALAERDPAKSETLLQQYVKEFPHNCKGHELLAALDALKRPRR